MNFTKNSCRFSILIDTDSSIHQLPSSITFSHSGKAFFIERTHSREVTQVRVTYIPSVPFDVIFRCNALTHMRGHSMRRAYNVQSKKRSEICVHFLELH